MLANFWLCLAICNSATTLKSQYSNNGQVEYVGNDEEELALIKSAAQIGFILRERNKAKISIRVNAHVNERARVRIFRIKAILPFDTTRNTMSIIYKTDMDEYIMFSKSSDPSIFRKLSNKNLTRHMHLSFQFSHMIKLGYQTSIFTMRTLTKNHYTTFKKCSRLFEKMP